MASVKINYAIKTQPTINGDVTISKMGLITKKAMISFWYQLGELPKKLFWNACANVAVIFLSFVWQFVMVSAEKRSKNPISIAVN